MNINLVYMRNFIFSIVVLLSLTAFAPVAEAQEKVLTLSEAEALLEKAQQKYDQAKKDYRKSLKSPQEGTSLKAMRAASREVGRYRLEIFKAHKRDYLRGKQIPGILWVPASIRSGRNCGMDWSLELLPVPPQSRGSPLPAQSRTPVPWGP